MGKLKELGDADNLNNEDKEKIRRTHHTRIRDLLVEHPDIFGLQQQEATYIGKIASGHREVDLSDVEEFRSNDVFDEYTVNIPLLAAVLRLADELDITHKRIPAHLYKYSQPLNEFSKDEWEKHWNVYGLTFCDNGVIRATAICGKPRIHRRLREQERKINDQLNELPKHLHQYSSFETSLPRRFQLTIEQHGYTETEIKLEFDPRAIMNLLMGVKLYAQKEYAVRELLKNAIDACRRKSQESRKKKIIYKPGICVRIYSNKLILADNGTGMDTLFLKNFFAKIGQSYYKKIREHLDFTPLGELGIGMLSYFMISDKITIKSKTDESRPIFVEITDVSDYVFVNELRESIPTGTIVELDLKDKTISESNIERIVRHFARHIEFTLEVNGKGIDSTPFRPTIDYLSPRKASLEYSLHFIKINHEAVAGEIALIGKKERGKFTPIDNNMIFEKNKFILSNNGILIQDEIDTSFKSIIPPWLNRQLICGNINFLKHNLTLNLSRDVIIHDQEAVRLSSIIGGFIVEGICNLFNDQNIFDRSNTNLFIEKYILRTSMHMMASARNRYGDDSVTIDWDRENMKQLIRNNYSFWCFNNSFKYLKYYDIPQYSKEPIIIEFPPSSNYTKTQIISKLDKSDKLDTNAFYLFPFPYELHYFLIALFPKSHTIQIELP